MINVQTFFISCLLSPLFLGYWLSPISAQTLPTLRPELENSSSTTTIQLTAPNGENLVFPLNSSANIPEVKVTATTLLTTGVSKNAISIAIDFVQGGANMGSVVTLMQNLQGLVQENNQVNIAQLNQAIAAYNRIVDTSDLATLETLKTMPAFLNIKELLEEIQNSDS
ncbi:MAG: hypothetical protein VKL42_11955 [Snowella sp.]|nr:hypothetical protein [Snowella sp.]